MLCCRPYIKHSTRVGIIIRGRERISNTYYKSIQERYLLPGYSPTCRKDGHGNTYIEIFSCGGQGGKYHSRVVGAAHDPAFLSRKRKALEKELGKQLLLRGSHKITLTEEGMILRRGEKRVELMEKIRSKVQVSGELVMGDLHIGGGETFGMELVTETVRRLHTCYPKIRVRLFNGNPADILERLNNGLLDFGLVIAPADLKKYDYLKLPYRNVWGLLMPRDHSLAKKKPPARPEDLEGLPLLVSRQAMAQDGLSG